MPAPADLARLRPIRGHRAGLGLDLPCAGARSACRLLLGQLARGDQALQRGLLLGHQPVEYALDAAMPRRQQQRRKRRRQCGWVVSPNLLLNLFPGRRSPQPPVSDAVRAAASRTAKKADEIAIAGATTCASQALTAQRARVLEITGGRLSEGFPAPRPNALAGPTDRWSRIERGLVSARTPRSKTRALQPVARRRSTALPRRNRRVQQHPVTKPAVVVQAAAARFTSRVARGEPPPQQLDRLRPITSLPSAQPSYRASVLNPHSLSYQLETLTRRPETLVRVASKIEERAS